MKFFMTLALAASGLIVSVPLFAHHGNASYDTSKTVTVKGTVTEYVWSNPHVYRDGRRQGRQRQHVALDHRSSKSLVPEGVGWTKNTFKPGDEVLVEVYPSQERPVLRRRTFGFTTPNRDQWQTVQTLRNHLGE